MPHHEDVGMLQLHLRLRLATGAKHLQSACSLVGWLAAWVAPQLLNQPERAVWFNPYLACKKRTSLGSTCPKLCKELQGQTMLHYMVWPKRAKGPTPRFNCPAACLPGNTMPVLQWQKLAEFRRSRKRDPEKGYHCSTIHG